jgi:two-component system clock-associated histidine kinase SasA
VLQFDERQPNSKKDSGEKTLLRLLLFVDRRPSAEKHIQEVQTYLESLKSDYAFELDVVEINKQPHLVEHFKLVATPALVKISPLPRQTLAGSNLIAQLQKWWSRWQGEVDELLTQDPNCQLSSSESQIDSISYSAELIKLSDDIFRLQKEKEELAEQLRFKDQILAMLAHDLRNPLTAAAIAVETIELSEQQGNPDTEKAAKLKKQLFSQAKRQFSIMNRMIGELLQTSQRIGAKLKVERRKLNLQPLFEEIIVQFNKQFQQKSLTFTQDIPQDIPLVYADEELIRQLLVNLLDNATKYTPEGGKISLSILHRTNQKVQISIVDTGPGIPPENRERIFEGHFRLQRDRAQEGYGLGLALCHKIVCAHYGQIWVDSSPQGGSCFHFTLPTYR